MTALRQRVAAIRRLLISGTGAQPKLSPRRALTSPFETWGYEKADQIIAETFEAQTIDISRSSGPYISPSIGSAISLPRRSFTNPIVVNRAFFQGDHWQNGDGWIGPHPDLNDAGYDVGMQEIALIFTSKNVVREATIRHALGVIGRTIQWGFTPIRELNLEGGETPTTEELTAVREATKLMRPWLTARKVSSLMRDAVCTLLLSERASVILIVPPGLAVEGPGGKLLVVADSIEEALGLIWPKHPLPDNATVVVDADTQLAAGVWRYLAFQNDAPAALAEGSADTRPITEKEQADYASLCYIGADGKTVTRIFRDGEEEAYTESEMDLGGRIPMFEMHRAALITTQVQQGQRALNLAESMIPRTAVTAGFLERLLIDAQMPGDPEVDADGNKTGRWIEKPFFVGAGTTNVVQSTEYVDEEGKVRRANAHMIYREPIPATGPIAASDKHYRSILDETGQLHVVMAGDSNPSGTSRVNARIEYLSTLQLTQSEVEELFRFIVDTTLAMAEALAEKPGHYTSLIRCQASCRLDTGPISPQERTALEASIGKTLSQETAMMLLGIEDIEAERIRMSIDPYARATLGKQVGDALTALTTPGATLEGAATFIGVTPEMLAKLLTGGQLTAPTLAPTEKSPGSPTAPGTNPVKGTSGKPGIPGKPGEPKVPGTPGKAG